ncbi:hypothetical protein P4493_04320 [Bacillus thuringiensis]|jgi:hypothetical protein|nr:MULTISPECIES: hypothetical protein [Bacillus]MEC2535502.1 hypothetical protein [Bacillus cereus]MED1153784.1 hypothetical protein [Bacillus paranthracis]OUB09354.1 hypothetical protein BK708_33055 [Bacillus thuringiensis serovar yunnanensis]AFQ30096.1 hypothetical protein BTF1_29977 [Bacillus thuringiensis HD-789]AJG74063.1 hypothetical protein BF38_5898 [Bacillus thuringiensis]
MQELQANPEMFLMNLEEKGCYTVSDDLTEIKVERQGTRFKFSEFYPTSGKTLVQTFDLKRLIHVLVENKKIEPNAHTDFQLKDVYALSRILLNYKEGTHHVKSATNYTTFANRWFEGTDTSNYKGVMGGGDGKTLIAFKTLLSHPEYGLYTEHIEAPTEERLKQVVQNYRDKDVRIVSFKQKEMVSGSLKVKDMVEGKEYEAIADSDNTNDTIAFRKEGDWIFSEIRGGEFEEPYRHSYKLVDIVKVLADKDHINRVPFDDMDIDYLMWVDFEVYCNVTAYAELPEEFRGMAVDTW